MIYTSTRSDFSTDSVNAVLSGIAPDGGLFVSNNIEKLDFDWKKAVTLKTQEISAMIMSALLDDFNDIDCLVKKAYDGKFDTPDLVPLKKVGNFHMLELFHGPTSAFKDVALSMLPVLMTQAMKQTGSNKKTVILTATSGDTGKAALEGFHDVDDTHIMVFYPYGGVSAIQQAQMCTQSGKNVNVCAVRGNFDDCQTGVKKAFASINATLNDNSKYCLSSANSINIGRLVPQIVYYFSAYRDIVADCTVSLGQAVDYVVPTGNFGDILAGFYAKMLGLPVGKLVCASNANNVLTDFFETGVYDKRRKFYKTESPSMDILVSSNLERLLYIKSGYDCNKTAMWMKSLSSEGFFKVDSITFNSIKDDFDAFCCNTNETTEAIRDCYESCGYLCDPHTAVACSCAQKYIKGIHNPVVILSTASPYKFPKAVCNAIGINDAADEFALMNEINEKTSVPVPPGLSGLNGKAVIHKDVISIEDMEKYIRSHLE